MADATGSDPGRVAPTLAPQAVRDALARVLEADELRSSPQLSNILRFVVEATLEGRQDAIKGYTIAVEALGRDASFDPQTDPIVRVEATRLRRALERYYAGTGATDDIVLVIPRGSYVPQFVERRSEAAPLAPGEGPGAPPPAPAGLPAGLAVPGLASPDGAAAGGGSSGPASPAGLGLSAMGLPGTGPGDTETGDLLAAAPADRASRRWMLGLVAVLVLVVALGGLLQMVDPSGWQALLAGAPRLQERTNRLGIPMIEVRPFETAGTFASMGAAPVVTTATAAPAAGEFDPRAIEMRVRDALARFDLLDVLATPEVRPSADCSGGGRLSAAFSLGGMVENHEDGSVAVLLRLADVCDGTIVWSREFESLRRGNDPTLTEVALVRDIMAAVAEPYGIIQARARARIAAAGAPLEQAGPYGCVLMAYGYWRSYLPAEHRRARECLEAAVAGDTGFAVGNALLAELYLDEMRNGVNPRTDAPALNRALAAAEQAVELAPTSAYARRVLMDVHFFRGERGPAIAAGEAALELNPYDVDIMADVGGRLIAYGEQERGEAMLASVRMIAPGMPPSVDYNRVIAAYLRGDIAAATAAADHLMGEGYAPGLLARALASHLAGDDEGAAGDLHKLVALAPAWANETELMVARFFPDPAIARRVRADLAAAGLPQRKAEASAALPPAAHATP